MIGNILLYGINLVNGWNNTIRGNNVSLNMGLGVALGGGAIGNKLFDNEIRENFFYGIWISGGQENMLYENQFINNTLQNAVDDGVNNKWDNGVIGNYWSNYTGDDKNDDGIGDTEWDIPGSAGSQDRYPIWDDGPEPILPPSDGDGDGNGKKKAEEAIPGYNLFILIGVISILSIIIAKKHKKIKR